MIVQNAGADGSADISFTVLEDDLPKALAAVQEGGRRSSVPKACSHNASVSKVSIVGLGMATQTGVADRMFRALADEDINIQAITTSEIKVSVLVKREQALAALRAVHSEFELDRAAEGSREIRREAPAAQAGERGRHRRPAAANGRPRDRKRVARRIAGADDVVRCARSPRHLGPHLRSGRLRGHPRRHDRAEHRPRRTGRHQLHRAAEVGRQARRVLKNARRRTGRRSEGRAGRRDSHGERRRHSQPHRRRPADVQGALRSEASTSRWSAPARSA